MQKSLISDFFYRHIPQEDKFLIEAISTCGKYARLPYSQPHLSIIAARIISFTIPLLSCAAAFKHAGLGMKECSVYLLKKNWNQAGKCAKNRLNKVGQDLFMVICSSVFAILGLLPSGVLQSYVKKPWKGNEKLIQQIDKIENLDLQNEKLIEFLQEKQNKSAHLEQLIEIEKSKKEDENTKNSIKEFRKKIELHDKQIKDIEKNIEKNKKTIIEKRDLITTLLNEKHEYYRITEKPETLPEYCSAEAEIKKFIVHSAIGESTVDSLRFSKKSVEKVLNDLYGARLTNDVMSFYKVKSDTSISQWQLEALIVACKANITRNDIEAIWAGSELKELFFKEHRARLDKADELKTSEFADIDNQYQCLFLDWLREPTLWEDSQPKKKKGFISRNMKWQQLDMDMAFLQACRDYKDWSKPLEQQNPLELKFGETEFLSRLAYGLFSTGKRRFSEGVLFISTTNQGPSLYEANVIHSKKGVYAACALPVYVKGHPYIDAKLIYRGTYCWDSLLKRDLKESTWLTPQKLKHVKGPGQRSFELSLPSFRKKLPTLLEEKGKEAGTDHVKLTTIGHSLGGCDAKRMLEELIRASSEKGKDSIEQYLGSMKLVKVKCHAYASPVVELSTANRFHENLKKIDNSNYLKYLERKYGKEAMTDEFIKRKRWVVSADNNNQGDLVPKFGYVNLGFFFIDRLKDYNHHLKMTRVLKEPEGNLNLKGRHSATLYGKSSRKDKENEKARKTDEGKLVALDSFGSNVTRRYWQKRGLSYNPSQEEEFRRMQAIQCRDFAVIEAMMKHEKLEKKACAGAA